MGHPGIVMSCWNDVFKASLITEWVGNAETELTLSPPWTFHMMKIVSVNKLFSKRIDFAARTNEMQTKKYPYTYKYVIYLKWSISLIETN